ncbi:MAG: molybdopterin-dependent oxidoreductase, partial [Saprospiraceae bacterium]|nr:molybdopterin-dependent oxidoreductase [Saprospiraceae bacterium]
MKPFLKNLLDRRAFLEISAKSAAAVGIATVPGLSCLAPASVATKTVYAGCYHDCPDRCSWKVTTKGNEIIKFTGSDLNPYTNGQTCGKMSNFPMDVTFHPDRILKPLKRSGPKGSGSFEEISWEQAIREVAQKLQQIIAEKGAEAILPFNYGGNQGLIHGNSIGGRFFARIGASQLDKTICGNTTVAGITATNGQTTGVLPEDIIHSRYIVLWGTNPIVSNQHLWPLIEQARVAGAKIVTVDPFVSKTAAVSDLHIQPWPGTDTALALGMMKVIIDEGLQDQDYIDKYTQGYDQLKAHLKKYDLQTVATMTGLDENTISSFAREYANASPSLIRTLIGMEHHANGASAFRAVAMLPALTGAWRELGGGQMNMTYELFGETINWQSVDLPESLSQQTTRMINMIELGKALNDATMAPTIDALFVYN